MAKLQRSSIGIGLEFKIRFLKREPIVPTAGTVALQKHHFHSFTVPKAGTVRPDFPLLTVPKAGTHIIYHAQVVGTKQARKRSPTVELVRVAQWFTHHRTPFAGTAKFVLP